MSISDTLKEWYKNWQMDPRTNPEYVVSGDRLESDPMTSHCQYWVKGMPGLCNNWDDSSCECGYGWSDSEDKPLNFNGGKCDGLGRAFKCNKYSSSVNAEPGYICALPKLDMTGVGKQDPDSPTAKLTLVPIDEIGGYNPDGCIGQCDGVGMGRGSAGYGESINTLYTLPVVCQYYRPWQMGFGAVIPRGIPAKARTKIGGRWLPDPDAKTSDIYDGSEDDPRSYMYKQLPHGFKVYNARAIFQKCAYWDADTGSEFILEDSGDSGLELIMLNGDDLCTCGDSSATPYHTLHDGWAEDMPWIVQDVWSKADTVICNGAKPECPCYTGRWIYCNDEKMHAGMRITVDQVMELRFWTSKWNSKAEYIEFFEEKPGPTDASGVSDPTTHLLYTFTHWDRLDPSDPNASVMKGYEYDMCVPAPLHKRYYDPDIYIEKNAHEYPPLVQFTPGSTTTESPRFPTLVRDFETIYAIPLDIYYPYSVKDPFGEVICDQPPDEYPSIKKNYTMESDSIIIIGSTIREKDVYAVNINNVRGYFLSVNKYITDYKSVESMPTAEKYTFYEEINNIIKTLEREKPEELYLSQSNSSGFFTAGPVKLNYTEYNDIIILVKVPDSDTAQDIPDAWEFRMKKVWSQFHGGMVTQRTFEYAAGAGTYDIGMPVFFPVMAPATAECVPIDSPNSHGLSTAVGWVKNTYSYKYVNPLVEYDYYAYVIVDKTMENQITETWVQIGNSDKIWVEIDDEDLDYKLNYILPWEVVSAKMERIYGEDETPVELEVEMEAVYPNAGVQQNNMPPNACVLEPKDGKIRGFFNPDWVLSITYKYRYIDDSLPDSEDPTVSIVFPNIYEGFNDGVYFVPNPPAQLSWYGGNSYSMSTAERRGTMSAMTGFYDEDGRLFSAIATKLVSYITTQYCRNVEIFYAYTSNASGYDLMPNSGFFTYTAGNKALSGDFVHGITAPCGTHDCNPSNCIGPMWFPFVACGDIMYYNTHTGPNQCTVSFKGKPEGGIVRESGGFVYRNDYRYVNPELYKAWARQGGNWAAACGNGWYYSYSKASSSVQFKGYCNIRGKVDVAEFNANQWQLPPFGNSGREIVERWLSKEHTSYIDLSQEKPTTETMWMPHIFDDSDLYFSFNCFDETSGEHPTAPDYFSHISQLSLMVYSDMSETVQEDRYKFKDIIELTHHGACMYPAPYALRPSGATGVTRYSFKNNTLMWAWRDFWDPLERTVGGEEMFYFLALSYPEYYYNPYKDEIQYVCDENIYELQFTAPEIEEGEMLTYPSISLGGGEPRYFEVIYDDYNHTLVDWKDEDEEGAVGGSSGGNIYEKTSGSEWNHDENILFSPGAVETTEEAKVADREVQTGYDNLGGGAIFKYYNKGLIASIYKDMLAYLPMEEQKDDTDPVITGQLESNIYQLPGEMLVTQLNADTANPVLNYTFADNICVTKIVVNGYWGVYEKSDEDGKKINVEVCKPGILLTSVVGESTTVIYNSGYLDAIFIHHLGGSNDTEKYSITANITPTPKRMIVDTANNLAVKLKIINGGWICIDSVELYYSEYVDGAVENIRTWEQRYKISTSSSFGDANLDGTQSNLYRSYDRDYKNAGQYFPSENNPDAFSAKDKMTSIACNDMGPEKESVDITYSNLQVKEEEVQREVYEEMLELDTLDTITYELKLPPLPEKFLESIGIQSNIISGPVTFKSEKLPYEKNSIISRYIPGNYWRPGGHWYRWGSTSYKTRCYLFGDIEEVFSPVFIHHDHGGIENPVDPGHAYAGWVRLDYYEGKLNQFHGEPHIGDAPIDPLTGAQQNLYSQP